MVARLDEAVQRATLRRIASVTAPGGALVVGSHERLPTGQPDFEDGALGVYTLAW